MSVVSRALVLALAVCFANLTFADEVKNTDETKAAETKTAPAKQPDKTKADDKKTDDKKADDKKAADKKGDKTKTDEPKKEADPVAEFEVLVKRKAALFTRLKTLQKTFAEAKSNAQKIEIRNTFEDIVREFQVSVHPEMTDLASKVYAAKPDNLDAAELVMQEKSNKYKHQEAYDIAMALLKAGRKTPTVLNIGGSAAFVVHDFETCNKLLKEAKERGVINRVYADWVDYSEQYIAFWKEEQEIRKREAELKDPLPRVKFVTTKGEIHLELFEEQAPNTVANFISLVEGKKYDGIKFHRVLPNFVCQAGDPNTLDDDPKNDGQGGPGYKIKCECLELKNPRVHFTGSLSMAHAGANTGGSQFFITHIPTAWLNTEEVPVGNNHTVFGRVVKGLELITDIEEGDTITTATVINKRDHPYVPVKIEDEDKKTDDGDASKTDDKKTTDDKKPADDKKAADDKGEASK